MKYKWIFDERIDALVFGDSHNGGGVVEEIDTTTNETLYYGNVVQPFALNVIGVGPFTNAVEAQEAVEKEYDRILFDAVIGNPKDF